MVLAHTTDIKRTNDSAIIFNTKLFCLSKTTGLLRMPALNKIAALNPYRHDRNYDQGILSLLYKEHIKFLVKMKEPI